MKKVLKIGGFLAAGGILAALYIWFFVYNKPHRNYETAEPEYVLTAQECYQSFSNQQNGGENSKNVEFNGKVLQISGIASKIETLDSSTIVVFVYKQGDFGDEGIRCTLLPNYVEEAKNLDLSSEITLKGFCSGYNDTDVILQYCSIIKN